MIKKSIVYLVALPLFMFTALAFTAGSVDATNYVSGVSSNTSEEELVALIAKLQKQLEEIRKNKVQCLLADVDLSIGDGEDDGLKEYVKSAQNFLKEKGYLKANATGYFGKFTRTALTNFQRDNNLKQTGELDVPTRNFIKGLKCRKDFFINKKNEVKSQGKDQANTSGAVTSITLEVSGNTAKWSTVGYSKNGFKIVWSKNPNPTYPTRDGDKFIYTAETTAFSVTLDAFSGSGTYYVKVCEYLGGSCGISSNEVTTSL